MSPAWSQPAIPLYIGRAVTSLRRLLAINIEEISAIGLYYCDGTCKMLFREGRFIGCTIEDTKLKREEKERKGGRVALYVHKLSLAETVVVACM